jgi:crotonobetainyl-CoA:carnitine CoA-transferase CaiB-like acyl-CoA transferase
MIQGHGDHLLPSTLPAPEQGLARVLTSYQYAFHQRTEGIRAHAKQVNRNKKSLALSFADPKGVEILHRLAASSDILVENYLPGSLKKYRMDYETIHNLNPRYRSSYHVSSFRRAPN